MPPTSVYFNNQNATREQFLVEDLIIESIRNHGIDIYYLPRTSQSTFDQLFGDDPVKYYDRAYKIDMYMETFNDFEGQQEFFSKFGLNIDKTAKVAVARRTFERFVPSVVRSLPKEGDLIYLPVQQKLLEIRFVEEEKNFFQLGKVAPYMYGLSIETFRYNGEFLNTGIEELDFICDEVAPSILFDVVTNANTNVSYERGEAIYQGANTTSATAKGIVADFDRVNLQVRVRNIKGTFANNIPAKGATTGANFTISTNDPMENATSLYDDNVLLETEADNILDFSETNPFGEP
jgi:hypothetical protein